MDEAGGGGALKKGERILEVTDRGKKQKSL
jgi:hypothetical protein